MSLRPALLLIVSALAARLAMLALFDPLANYGGGDGALYLRVAAEGFGASMPFHPPGYPAFLMVAGPATLLLQSLATVGAALLTLYKIPGKLGRWVAFAIATCPFFIVYEFVVLAEALLCAMLWSAFLLIAAGRRQAALGGVLLGLAILTRDTLLLLPLAMLPFAWWAGVGKKALIAALAAYLVILPWPLRNSTLPDGHFAMSEGRFGLNLWVGTWERDPSWLLSGVGNFPDTAYRSPAEKAALTAAWRVRDDRPFRQVAVDRILNDPATTLATWAVRYPRLWIGTRTDQIEWRLERGSTPWTIFKTGFFGLNLLLLALGGIGAFLADRRYFLFLAPVAYTALIYVPFHNAETRYSLPALPFLILFAASAVAALVARQSIMRRSAHDRSARP